MPRQWTALKKIIGRNELQKEVFLSLIDEKGNIVCANSMMVKTLELKNPREYTTSIFSLLHPQHVDTLKSAIRNSKKNSNCCSAELYLKNGAYHPMKWQIRYLDKKTSPVESYLCIGYKKTEDAVVTNITDVTEVHKITPDLQEKEALKRAFLDYTPTLTWVLDENASFLFASHSFCHYFGLDEKLSVNKNIFNQLPLAVDSTLYAKHLQVLQTGLSVETVEKMIWADGTELFFNINIFPIVCKVGRKLVGGNAVNLTEKYAIEKQLHQANDRLLLLTRATSDAIWEWDMQTGYIFRNDAFMNMIGYQAENRKGLSWWLRRIHPDDRDRVIDRIKDATDKGQQSWEEKYLFKCADGAYKYVHDHGYVVYENGLPVKMIGSLQDVSDLKNLEDKLVEEKLRSQKEISETVIRAQEMERTRIGHELHDNVNQILATTKLFVDMMTPNSETEIQAKEKSLAYILMAVEEIRKLSKELVVPQLKGEGLVDSIRTLVNDIHFSNAINIRFTHDADTELLTQGKKVTLFRIVQEQLKNILKHSSANQVDIYLQSKEGNTQLIIKDDGIGFDPHLTHNGIGLSNINERARFYSGTVEIQTAPGTGCTLVVTIPSFE